MVRLHSSLAEAGCRKPGCGSASPLHRHHRKHPKIWFGIWSSRRAEDPIFQELKRRYALFLDEDCVIICEDHHAEIHVIYDRIIQDWKRRLGKPLYKFTWREAELLMDALENACNAWLCYETPGVDQRRFIRFRRKRAT